MLDELLALLDTVEFENDGVMTLSRVTLEHDTLTLDLEVITGDETDVVQHWQILCGDIREHQLELRAYSDLQLQLDHVLLWPHLMPRTAVSFYAHIDNALPIIGALYQRHMELVGSWIPFDRYFNMPDDLASLLQGTAGRLAEGPEALILAYEDVLQRYSVQASHVPSQVAGHWQQDQDGIEWLWVEERGPLAVLLLEQSFVVAATFSAHRLSNNRISQSL